MIGVPSAAEESGTATRKRLRRAFKSASPAVPDQRHHTLGPADRIAIYNQDGAKMVAGRVDTKPAETVP